MGPKKLIAGVIAVISILAAGFFFWPRPGARIHVLTWSNYFSDKTISDFQKKTGIKVELSYMSSNEELFAKLKAGATGYDIIQPSDYMVRQMIALKMLQPISSDGLPHLSHIDPFYKKLPYDPGLQYSVPFSWGTTGIAINTAKVSVPPEGVSWKMLFDSPDIKHTSVLDDQREAFAAALKYRGHSINERTRTALDIARAEIQKIRPNILTFTSEPKSLLVREEVYISHIYSCDGVQAQYDNPSIKYFIPKEGGTIWTDNFAIPRTSGHVAEAHQFIDYFLDPENAVPVFRDNHLSTPNASVLARLPDSERLNPNQYPPKEVLEKMQFLDDPGDQIETLTRMWTELKS